MVARAHLVGKRNRKEREGKCREGPELSISDKEKRIASDYVCSQYARIWNSVPDSTVIRKLPPFTNKIIKNENKKINGNQIGKKSVLHNVHIVCALVLYLVYHVCPLITGLSYFPQLLYYDHAYTIFQGLCYLLHVTKSEIVMRWLSTTKLFLI